MTLTGTKKTITFTFKLTRTKKDGRVVDEPLGTAVRAVLVAPAGARSTEAGAEQTVVEWAVPAGPKEGEEK